VTRTAQNHYYQRLALLHAKSVDVMVEIKQLNSHFFSVSRHFMKVPKEGKINQLFQGILSSLVKYLQVIVERELVSKEKKGERFVHRDFVMLKRIESLLLFQSCTFLLYRVLQSV
jgi:hypothetical protein